jgi:thiol-disulfide isomerase/thioredoxin
MTARRRPSRMLRIALILGLLALAAPAHAGTLKVGDRVAELDVAVDANGKSVKLKAYTGKWILVTVGAAWCKPCKKELPVWDKIAGEKLGKVTFIAIAIDDDINDGKAFHNKLKLKNLKRVYLPNEKSSVGGSYGSDTMPTSFLIDPKGIVRHVHKGFEDGDEKKLRDQLAKHVK